MSQVEAKLCPQCRCEYLPTSTMCADCDVALVLPDEIVDEPPPDELPPPSEMVPLRIASVGVAVLLSEALQEAEISHRVDAPPQVSDDPEGRASRQSHDQGVAVYVLPEDEEAARVVDAEFLDRAVPDSAAVSEAGDEACPACGDPAPADAAECPSCGLPFLDLD